MNETMGLAVRQGPDPLVERLARLDARWHSEPALGLTWAMCLRRLGHGGNVHGLGLSAVENDDCNWMMSLLDSQLLTSLEESSRNVGFVGTGMNHEAGLPNLHR